jgi:hypothetical protein
MGSRGFLDSNPRSFVTVSELPAVILSARSESGVAPYLAPTIEARTGFLSDVGSAWIIEKTTEPVIGPWLRARDQHTRGAVAPPWDSCTGPIRALPNALRLRR